MGFQGKERRPFACLVESKGPGGTVGKAVKGTGRNGQDRWHRVEAEVVLSRGATGSDLFSSLTLSTFWKMVGKTQAHVKIPGESMGMWTGVKR